MTKTSVRRVSVTPHHSGHTARCIVSKRRKLRSENLYCLILERRYYQDFKGFTEMRKVSSRLKTLNERR